MKKFYEILVSIIFLFSFQLFAQEVYSEMPFIVDNGVVKCRRIVVAFNQNVIPTTSGVTIVDTASFSIQDASIKKLLKDLSIKYGYPIIRKTIPRLVWGDTLVTNKRTGIISKVPDMSQSFRLDFPIPVPLDSVLYLFRKLPVIKYAEEPVTIAPLVTPSDPYFSSQWNLSKINASQAWDITTGSSNIRVAVIDVGYADYPFNISNHEDFQLPSGGNKFVGGSLNNSSDHARMVAGIVGATTNNGTGIASLGWNTSLLAYHYVSGTAQQFLPGLIDLAIAPENEDGGNADIINFSITTLGMCVGELCPQQFYDVHTAIQRAIAAGVVLIAAAGNGEYNGCDPFDCNGGLPYLSYPAAYSEVIAVTATNPSDNWQENWNSGSWVDVAAPGSGGIYTLNSTYNSYVAPEGTSFSAPQVSALVALILALNPSLTPSVVKTIIEQSADKVGQYPYVNGRNNYLGYGRINAYNALLLTHAYSNKSISSSATSNSSQRKIVRDSNGNYHIVFLSGGEIFYQKTTDNGNSWQTPTRLSTGNGNNNYPSIAKGSSNQIMVVWQRGNNPYDIHFTMSTDGGATWPTDYKYVLASSVSSTNAPVPVITMNQSNQRKTIVYNTNSGLFSMTTTYSIPASGNWTTQQITTSSSDIDPTIASCGTSAYNVLAYRNGSNICYMYQNSDMTWSSCNTLSTMIPGQSWNVAPTICGMSSDGSVHLAWTRYTYSGGYPTSPKTFYMKNTSANGSWPYQYWQVSSWDQVYPTITALASNKIDLIFRATNNGLYKQRFNGSSWNSPSLVAYPTSNYPSVSIGGIEAKYVYTNGSFSPFTVQLSTEVLTKENVLENIEKYYSRSVAFIKPEGSFVEYILHDIKVSNENNTETLKNLLPAILEDKSLSSLDAFDVQSSEYFILDKDAEEIIIDYNINSLNSEKVVNDINKPVYLVVAVMDENGKQLNTVSKSIDITQKNDTFFKQSITILVAGITGNVKVKTYFEGLEANKETIVSLGHLYDYSSFSTEKENIAIEVKTETVPSSYSLSNYPNPFNPRTIINFSLPKESKVSLRIYDVLGKLIETVLENEIKSPGNYEVNFNANDLPSGVYFYTLTTGDFVQTRKMILTK